ncbi:response regulator transcription factor [candidate division KSB1 bacterium]|nr:response regulator transcription factor [candidate division KSB1 bacterium]
MRTKNPYKGSKILIVEDEESLAMGMEYNLQQEGYRVSRASDGLQAMDRFSQEDYDLIILDIMLPFQDGFEVAEKMLRQNPQLPILFLTARKAAQDRIKGLSIGADDYMTKPFHLEELLLRIRGMLKRKAWYAKNVSSGVLRFGDNEINFENLQCRAGKRTFQITPQEAAILKYLMDREGKIVSRKELLRDVWQMSAEAETRTVDNFIVRLRRYFEKNPGKPVFFRSVRGAGYMFNRSE